MTLFFFGFTARHRPVHCTHPTLPLSVTNLYRLLTLPVTDLYRL